MGLLLWIPFVKGNYEYTGTLNPTISTLGTITYETGKIGQAARIGTGTQVANGVSINTNLVEEFGDEYSCAVWIKPTGTHVHYEGAIISSGDWNKKKWAFGIGQNNTTVDPFGPSYNIKVQCQIPINEWTHLVSTVKNNVATVYKNGEFVGTYNFGSLVLESDAANTTVGRETYANGYFSFNGCIQDMRIYNHCLSAEEAKKISQGLVLHYSLSNRGFGGDNLLINSRSIATTGSDGTNKPIKTFDATTHIGRIEYVATTGLQNAYTWVTNNLGGASVVAELTTGQKIYTFSVDVRVTNYTSGNITAYINFRNDSGIPNINVGRLLTEDEKDGNWHRITATATSNNQQDTRSLFGFTNSSTPSGSLTVIEYKNPKLEAGSIATPWVPHSTDALYSSLQLGSTTEFDLSGYQYNGIKNNISNSSDSIINKGCYVFNGTDSWVKCDTNAWMVQGATEFTVNWWGYAEDWTAVTNGGRMISCTESGGFNIEGGASGYLRFPRYVYTNADKTSRAYQYSNNGIKLADLTPGWHMFTMIYTLTGEKIYIDGELHSSANYTSYGISFNTGARLFLGCEANGGNPGSPYFNGKLADYRFYYTALDENAIKELYMMGGEA